MPAVAGGPRAAVGPAAQVSAEGPEELAVQPVSGPAVAAEVELGAEAWVEVEAEAVAVAASAQEPDSKDEEEVTLTSAWDAAVREPIAGPLEVGSGSWAAENDSSLVAASALDNEKPD